MTAHPAALLSLLASDALRARGEPASAAAVARVLGEHPNAWGRYVRGEVSPSSERVARWVAALNDAEVHVGLFVSAEGWSGWRAPTAPSPADSPPPR